MFPILRVSFTEGSEVIDLTHRPNFVKANETVIRPVRVTYAFKIRKILFGKSIKEYESRRKRRHGTIIEMTMGSVVRISVMTVFPRAYRTRFDIAMNHVKQPSHTSEGTTRVPASVVDVDLFQLLVQLVERRTET